MRSRADAFEPRRESFSAIEPSQELMQVGAVATHGSRREIIALKLGQTIGEPEIG
jgi:hypothetical protein